MQYRAIKTVDRFTNTIKIVFVNPPLNLNAVVQLQFDELPLLFGDQLKAQPAQALRCMAFISADH